METLTVMLLVALALFAQMLDPLEPQQAYTTADPNNADRFGLATVDGRFAATAVQDCGNITVGQNILIYPAYHIPPWLAITSTDGSLPGCLAHVEGRMDNTPCFTNADGLCDIAAETNS